MQFMAEPLRLSRFTAMVSCEHYLTACVMTEFEVTSQASNQLELERNVAALRLRGGVVLATACCERISYTI